MFKNIFKIAVLVIACTFTANAQKSVKVEVLEDTFIEGGQSASIAQGVKRPKNMRIFNSNETTKYARTGYLKFHISKKIKEINSVELHFPLKVYPNENNPDGVFHLAVVGVSNDNWDENEITFDEALELGETLGTLEVPQSTDNKNQKLTIKLDTEAFKKLMNGKKDRYVTLALANFDFNRISAMAPTKEQSDKNAAYLMIK